MRICILTKGEPYGWTRHYIDAFRATGHDVLVAGPNITRDELDAYGLNQLSHEQSRTDIESALGPETILAHILPAAWCPDLVVAISMAGTPLCPDFQGIACPRVYLSIDTWQSPRDYVDALQYDFVFAAQQSFVPRLRAMGARNVAWLPLAANPAEHFPVNTTTRANVSFAGTISLPIHQVRLGLINRLRRETTFIGKASLFGPALCALCCSAKLTFNHSAVHDVNMRIFEALAMGCPLLTNAESDENGLRDLFPDAEHLIVYNNADHLIELVRTYTHDDAARRRIAWRGRREVEARHMYRHRVETILQTVADNVPGFATEPATGREADIVGESIPAGAGTLVLIGSDETTTRRLAQRTPRSVQTGAAESVDVVLITNVDALREGLINAIGVAAQCLRDGGTLLLRARPRELETRGIPIDVTEMRTWLSTFSFILQRAVLFEDEQAGAQALLLSARKRSTTLGAVVDETFRALSVHCQHVRDGIQTWSEENAKGL